jgi:hypothetical protein
MDTSKHDKAPLTSDLERDPGIGQSKGAFAIGEKPSVAAGENSVEGDVENDPAPDGSIPEDHLGRTNK